MRPDADAYAQCEPERMADTTVQAAGPDGVMELIELPAGPELWERVSPERGPQAA